MKRFVFAGAALGALCMIAPVARAEELSLRARGVSDCTVVAVQTVDEVGSASAHPGDFFRFETVNAVTAGAHIVVPAHTMGYGIVAIASAAGRAGKAGTLVLEPRYLMLPSGEKVGVVLDHNSNLQKDGASNNLPGYLGAIPIPGVGAAIGAFNYFHRGKDIAVPKGTMFAIFPSDEPQTERCQTAT